MYIIKNTHVTCEKCFVDHKKWYRQLDYLLILILKCQCHTNKKHSFYYYEIRNILSYI
jgi:hypothetical protein